MLIDADYFSGIYETPDLDSVLRLYGYDIGLDDYPIWDESKREWLNNRIIDHFRYRKISAETSTQFVFFLNRTMREQMPMMNPVFEMLENAAKDKSWLNYFTTDTASSKTNGDSSSRQVYSATPQAQLYAQGGENYATNLTDNSSNATNESVNESTHTGVNNMVSTALQEWLNGVNNALTTLFYGLEPCFIQIYN